MPLRLNIQKLEELFVDFHILTNIKIAIFDEEFTEIFAYPKSHCPFCALIRNTPDGERRCALSDKVGCNICKSNGLLHTYKCHAGLIETVAPIKQSEIVIGYVMFGQILDTDDRQAAWQDVSARCKDYTFDPITFKQAFDQLDSIRPQQIKAASKILEACACYLWLDELVSVEREQIIYRFDQYITQNLTQPLTTEQICSHLKVSRGMLYQEVRRHAECGVAEYIRNKRINLAKKMLQTSTDSIQVIAEKVGIPDYNYFSKLFKKLTGASPKEYRKQRLD